MKQVNNITNKIIRVKVSAGWTTERFLDEYGITQEVFNKKLLEVFPIKRVRAEVLRDLEQNDKRFKRGKKKSIKRKKIKTPVNLELQERFIKGVNPYEHICDKCT